MSVTRTAALVAATAIVATWSSISVASAPPATDPPASDPASTPTAGSVVGTIPDPAECAAGLTLEEGVLTIATGDPAFPPYVIDDDPESGEGFEAAVAYAVAEQLGFGPEEVTWVRTPFDTVIAPGPKEFDFNIQQYSISPERAEVVSFSIPYYTANQAIVGYADSPAADATELRDLRALRLGVATGTTSLVFAEEVIQPEEGVQLFNDNAGAVAALEAQQIDAIVADLPTALYVASEELEGGAVFGQFPTPDEAAGAEWGLLMEKDSPLVECVDYALLTLRESGELDAITEEWMTASVDAPLFDIDG